VENPSDAADTPTNQLVLLASIAETRPLRHTPAGLPALDLLLEHQSQQQEIEGVQRAVHMRLKAVAFGTLAERLARQALESCWWFRGFLAAARGGKGVVLHLQDIHPIY